MYSTDTELSDPDQRVQGRSCENCYDDAKQREVRRKCVICHQLFPSMRIATMVIMLFFIIL